MTYTKEDYRKYVEAKSPNSPLAKNMLMAFVIGGLICAAGQGFSNIFEKLLKLDKDTVSALTPISMIFLGSLFTGLNVYDSLAKHAGAGTIVPITGFANAITAPAMEFKKEGFVLGVICLYGLFNRSPYYNRQSHSWRHIWTDLQYPRKGDSSTHPLYQNIIIKSIQFNKGANQLCKML